MKENTTIAQLVGLNLAHIRDSFGLSTDDVARAARNFGMKWNTGTVSAMEAGRSSPTVPKLLALCAALEQATQGHQFGLPDLLGHYVAELSPDSPIEITTHLTLKAEGIDRMANGHPFDLVKAFRVMETDDVGVSPEVRKAGRWPEVMSASRRNVNAFTEAEYRAAKDLDISPQSFAIVAYELWAKSFLEERQERAGEGASPQKMGRITRALKSEMKDHLDRGND